jgi:hypothetical protein
MNSQVVSPLSSEASHFPSRGDIHRDAAEKLRPMPTAVITPLHARRRINLMISQIHCIGVKEVPPSTYRG